VTFLHCRAAIEHIGWYETAHILTIAGSGGDIDALRGRWGFAMGEAGLTTRSVARPILWHVLLASSMLTGIGPAFAQQTAGSNTIETVVVTAEKREENLQKVPMAIQAFSAQKLDDLNLTTFSQYVQYMPSVNFTVGGAGGGNGGPGFDNVFMRGVNSGNDGNHSGSLPTVGIYLDEQPISTIGGTLDIPAYDISRVEVLEGPQGTLYGASSESGTIRIITNKPDPSAFEAGYSAEVNTVAHGNEGYIGNGFVNIPLSDKAAIRIVAWDEHDAGYIDNVPGTRTYPTSGVIINNFDIAKNNFNTVDKIGGRAALKVDLNDNWTITPAIMAEDEKSNGVFGYDPSVGFLDVQHYYPEFVHDGWYQAALTVEGKISNFDVTYAGGYMDRRVHAESDYTDYSYWYDTLYPPSEFGYYISDNSSNPVDPSQYIIQKDHFTKNSQELRISSPKDDRFRFTAGAFYELQTHSILQDYKVNALGSDYWVGNDSVGQNVWPNTIWLTDQLRTDQDAALFGESSFDITPALTLTGGLRYFEAHNTLYGFFGFSSNFSSHTGEATCMPGYGIYKDGPCTNLDAKTTDHGFTHKLNLAYQIDDDKMIYATWSTGFRPGGDNRRTDFPPYNPDTLTNYELGWKTSWLNDTLRFDGDVYWENWNDFQFSFLGANSFTQISNAGNAVIKGIEADVVWKPIDGLTLSGAGNADDAQLVSNFCGPIVNGVVVTQCPGPLDPDEPQAPKGQQLPMDPKYKANATARYETPFGTWLGYVQGSVVYQSSQWPDLRNFTCDPFYGCAASGGISSTQPNGGPANLPVRTLIGQIPSSTTFNYTMGVTKDNWTLEFYVSNLFDEHGQLYRYAECASEVCGNESYVIPTQPRTIGLKFEQKF
jgi:iron complex outermembrane receptor protein